MTIKPWMFTLCFRGMYQLRQGIAMLVCLFGGMCIQSEEKYIRTKGEDWLQEISRSENIYDTIIKSESTRTLKAVHIANLREGG